MPLDDLPGTLILPTRDDVRDQYLRDFRFRSPGAVTIEGTLEFADASTFADGMAPVYFDTKNIGDHVAGINKRGKALDIELVRSGTSRLLKCGATGFVIVTTSAGGGTIFEGDEIKDSKSGQRYKCTATKLYLDQQYVPIIGVDTGPTTNLDAGRKLEWTFPRPGITPLSIVAEQTDGTGLSGGRNDETDDEANLRLQSLRANPPASGNDAQFQDAVNKTPGIPIQQCFTYPCIIGGGSIGIAFTLRPGTPGANRIPNPTQMAAVQAYIQGLFPADDSILMITLVASAVDLVFEVSWAPSAVAWQDLDPWPPRINADMVKVDGAVTPTATTFRLTTATTTTTPQVGQSLGFYDQPKALFRRKRIKSVAVVVANKSWDLVIETINGVSDINYIPNVNQTVGPWSDSLQALVPGVTNYFDTTGPGEQLSVLPDPNLRQHRTPRSPAAYSNTITNRMITTLLQLPTVGDLELKSPDVPFATPIGAQGIFAYLHSLGNITVFPQT